MAGFVERAGGGGGGGGGDQEVAVASYMFTPPAKPVQQTTLVQAILPPSFANVQKVTIVQEDPVTQALVVDDVVYCLNEK